MNILTLFFNSPMFAKTKVLLLDDYADVLDAIKIFLETEGYEVCAVVTSQSFIVELKRFKPDVIILDVFLDSKGYGRVICKNIKSDAATMHIPVILMSVSKKALENFEECQADETIEKPFELTELLNKIKHLTSFNNLKPAVI